MTDSKPFGRPIDLDQRKPIGTRRLSISGFPRGSCMTCFMRSKYEGRVRWIRFNGDHIK